MTKASKWIRNVLLGKKEVKNQTRASPVSAEILAIPEAILPENPRGKRRWSFQKTAATDRITDRSSNSFDAICTDKLVKQALQEQDIEQIRIKVASTNDSNGTVPVAMNPHAIRLQKDAAAVKIQAVFRSYLARRALRALRGLVKIQALVRGHLVRKQTASVLISMHALMTIQVRAREKRAQKAERKGISMKKSSHGESAPESVTNKGHKHGQMYANMHEQRKTPKSKSGPLYYPKAERIEHGFSKFHSGRLSIPKQEEHQQMCWSPSAMSDGSSINNDKQIGEMAIKMTQKSVQNSSNLSKSREKRVPATSDVPVPENPKSKSFDPFLPPSYMTETESSKAKSRSQSEPKQRPKWHPKRKSRRSTSTSTEKENVLPDNQAKHSSQIGRKEQENQYPWLMKLYRSAKPVKDSDIDSASVTTNNSNHGKSLIPFEPPVNLF